VQSQAARARARPASRRPPRGRRFSALSGPPVNPAHPPAHPSPPGARAGGQPHRAAAQLPRPRHRGTALAALPGRPPGRRLGARARGGRGRVRGSVPRGDAQQRVPRAQAGARAPGGWGGGFRGWREGGSGCWDVEPLGARGQQQPAGPCPAPSRARQAHAARLLRLHTELRAALFGGGGGAAAAAAAAAAARRAPPPGVRVDALKLLQLWDYEGGLGEQVGGAQWWVRRAWAGWRRVGRCLATQRRARRNRRQRRLARARPQKPARPTPLARARSAPPSWARCSGRSRASTAKRAPRRRSCGPRPGGGACSAAGTWRTRR
jgi:hypothetical protein